MYLSWRSSEIWLNIRDNRHSLWSNQKITLWFKKHESPRENVIDSRKDIYRWNKQRSTWLINNYLTLLMIEPIGYSKKSTEFRWESISIIVILTFTFRHVFRWLEIEKNIVVNHLCFFFVRSLVRLFSLEEEIDEHEKWSKITDRKNPSSLI